MAPSRRKGASKAAAAAAARRQWKVGDLVLAKVKGFPAWPATVSEPEKWGYSADWKKVLVFFFGTQQIAFCNPADVEPFTEEKKESLLVKRHGRGADFIRAVREIIDSYEMLKKQEQVVDASGTDEVNKANEDDKITEANDNKSGDLFHKSGSKKEAISLTLRSDLKTAESAVDDSDFHSLADLAASASEKDGFYGTETSSKEPRSNVVVTYSSRRKFENIQPHDCVTERRVQPTRRSRSSRADTSRHQGLPRNHGTSLGGDIAATMSRDRPGRRSKRLRKSPDSSERDDVGSPALVSNGSIGENDPDTGALSDTLGLNEGITADSACKSMQPESTVENCEREDEFSQRLKFQNHAVIFKKKRKPNRKRPSNDTTESTARLEKNIASEADMPNRAGNAVPSDHEILCEKHLKEDGDEHLPLVKRARVRMGASPHRPQSDGEHHENQVAEKLSEVSSSISKLIPESLNCEENDSANVNAVLIEGDRDVSSPLNMHSVKKPQLWEVRKIQPFSNSVDGEAALPPSKRLHRALEAMSANVAENSQTSSDGPAAVNVSNGYCSFSSGVCFEVADERKEEGKIDAPKLVPLIAEDGEKPFQEVAASSSLLSSDASPKHISDASPVRMSNDSPVCMSDDSPVCMSDASPVRMSDASPGRMSDASPERMTDASPDHMSDGSPERMSDGSPERMSDGSPERMSNGSPERINDASPQRISDASPQRISDANPQRISNASPQRISNASPQRVSNASPQRISNASPQCVSDASTQRVSDASPERISNASPQRISFASPQHIGDASVQCVNDAILEHKSCKDAIEDLDCTDGMQIDASSLNDHSADIKDAVQNLKESSIHVAQSAVPLDYVHGSPGSLMHSRNDTKLESSKLSKFFVEPESQMSWRSSDPMSAEENSSASQNCTNSFLSSAENNCIQTCELHEDKQNVAMADAVEESGPAKNSTIVASPPAHAKAAITTQLVQSMSNSKSTSDDQLGGKAASATQSSSSVTDGLDSGPRASPINTPACNTSISDNNNNNVLENNGCSSREALVHVKKPNFAGKSSSRDGPNVALASFEAALGTLTRSKESISRATYIAIDCVKLGIAAKVVEILTRKLETESSLHRKVDLFFLVDSITQCSRGMKGNLGGVFPSAIQTVLARLLSAAAPPGSSYQENRRQCLKVLRVWQERRILPESIIRHHIRELDSLCCSSSSGTNSRACKTERAFDDPIREMEGMLVDEYGSNSSIQLPGFRMPPMLRDGDDGSDSDEENFEAVTPEHNAENLEGAKTSVPEIEKHRHILEDVDGELEMEDVAPCEAEITTISSAVDGAHAQYQQFEHLATPFAPPVPKDIPPSSPPLPVSPPPPPPPPPPPSSFPLPPPPPIPCSASNGLHSELYTSAVNMKKDDVGEYVAQQPITSMSDDSSSHHRRPEGRDFHAHVPVQMRDAAHSSYASQPEPMSHQPAHSSSRNIQGADAAHQKSFHLRPPHPAPTNQFSYVQSDHRIQNHRDLPPPPNHNRYHQVHDTENGDYYRDRGRMKPAPRDGGDRWRSPAPPFSGPHHRSDNGRRPYGPASYPGPSREPAFPNERWDYPPRAGHRRDFMPHRPPPGGPIPVSSRGPNYWRPR